MDARRSLRVGDVVSRGSGPSYLSLVIAISPTNIEHLGHHMTATFVGLDVETLGSRFKWPLVETTELLGSGRWRLLT